MVTEYRIVADEQNPTPALSTQALDVVGLARKYGMTALLVGLLGLVGYLAYDRYFGYETSPIVGPSWVAPGRVAFLDIPDVGGDPKVTVIPKPSQFAVRSSDGGKFLLFSADQPGMYSVVYADIGGVWGWRKTILAEHAIQVSETPPDPGPVPPGPVPPGPGPVPPGPVPPGPGPLPPAPIPDAGFRVLIVYESGDMTKYSADTQSILTGAEVRGFLNQHCVSESGTPGFRIYDADASITHDLDVWQKAMARQRSSLPWVVISNGKTGFEGPLPKTPSEFLELCKRYVQTN